MIGKFEMNGDLNLVVTIETSDELAEYKDIKECLSICTPWLTIEKNDNTNAPIFSLHNHLFWLPDYLTNNPLEILRDTGTLTLKAVKL